MKTEHLDNDINELETLRSTGDLTYIGGEKLSEYREIKRELENKNTWISVEDRLPLIDKNNTRVELPIYVMLEDYSLTIADFTKSKLKDNVHWVSIDYKPIWICRERGSDNYGFEVNVIKWQPLPEPPTN